MTAIHKMSLSLLFSYKLRHQNESIESNCFPIHDRFLSVDQKNISPHLWMLVRRELKVMFYSTQSAVWCRPQTTSSTFPLQLGVVKGTSATQLLRTLKWMVSIWTISTLVPSTFLAQFLEPRYVFLEPLVC